MSLKIATAITIAIPTLWLANSAYCAWARRPKPTEQDVVRYRNDERSLFLSSQTYFTGYTTVFQYNRDENERESPMYQLPRELVIQVMEYLSPEDLYLTRQASSLFFSTFKNATFKRFHRIPSVQRWKPLYVWGKPPENEGRDLIFNTDHLTRFRSDWNWKANDEVKNYIVRRLRRDHMCRPCAKKFKPAKKAPKQWLRCVNCDREHRESDFSSAEKEKKYPVCLAWEGKQKICPHRYVSLFEPIYFQMDIKTNRAANVFECAECSSHLGLEKHEQPPTLTCLVSIGHGERLNSELEHGWKATIATLSKDQVVTKELLLQNLKRLDDILCPHTRSGVNPRILLDPFQRYHCVCFRGPTLDEPLCHAEHSWVSPDNACCACCASYESVGKFMASKELSGKCKHEASCSACSTKYTWSLEGNRIMLQMRRKCSSTDLVRIAQDKYAAKLKRDGKGKFICSLDPETYQGNKYTPKTHRCGDVACRDYRLSSARERSFS